MNAPERRRDVRIKTAFEVVNAIPRLEGVAFLSDLSSGGACLEGTSARPALGQIVQLMAHVSDRQPPLVLVGKVVRHAESGFAVSFEKPSPQLERFLQEETPEQSIAPRTQAASSSPPPAKRAGVSAYREVAVDCCANTQWISGRICTSPKRTLLDHLNQGEPFLRMVDALAPHHPEPMAFVALRSDAVDLILPVAGQEAIDTEQRVGKIVERRIRCLLPYAIIDGKLPVIDKIRVSDHLMRSNSFLALRDCRVVLAKGQRAPRDLSRVPIALLNVRRLIGVSDLAASPPPPDE